ARSRKCPNTSRLRAFAVSPRDAAPSARRRALPDLRVFEEANELAVEVPVLDAEIEDTERLLERNGLLVGAVAGGEGVVDVGDAHHLRLHRDLFRGELARVAGSVELLVVRSRDERHPAQGFAPRDLREELERVRDVRADLVELQRRQRAAVPPVDALRERDRQLGDAARVSARGRVARLDGLDAGGNASRTVVMARAMWINSPRTPSSEGPDPDRALPSLASISRNSRLGREAAAQSSAGFASFRDQTIASLRSPRTTRCPRSRPVRRKPDCK